VCEYLKNNSLTRIDRGKYLEYTVLLDYEAYVKHILVVEASDSNPDSPLQTIVTVEVSLSDLNDNRPLIVSLYSLECAARGGTSGGDFNTLSLLASLDNLNSGGLYSSGGGTHAAAAVNSDNMKVIMQSSSASSTASFATVINVNRQQSQQVKRAAKKFYSSKIVIEGLSEYSVAGKCLGQFQVSDADTPYRNRHLQARVWSGSYDKLTETSLVLFTNLRSRLDDTGLAFFF
jgi:hypothetical protein